MATTAKNCCNLKNAFSVYYALMSKCIVHVHKLQRNYLKCKERTSRQSCANLVEYKARKGSDVLSWFLYKVQ